ncbi:YheC/YheD family protein [Salipaludibacillus daqingensis]|uniref:YheC/YheD family endospore coat-associated protein n=1 Tax=Salipaludibacillus daqingensis TaxID=3041001 RepID=UPI002474BB6D|nr:YheC/YheD family protein [Salipaludibacillus daqingensis]
MISQKDLSGYFGVLISSRAWREMSKNQPHYRLVQLAEANKEVYFNVYFFPVKNIDLIEESITGYYYDFIEKTWKTGSFPYPDVLYRRGGPSRKFREHYHTFLDQCHKRDTIMLNPVPLGNWEIYDYFGKVKRLKPYLMETILYRRPDHLFNMLKKHQNVYMKGVTGRKGEQVVRVEIVRDNLYKCKYYNHSKQRIRTKRFKTMDDMIPFINKFYKGKNFMVQEGIDLLELDGRRLDLRAELQRNKKGEIDITGISARMSKKNSPVTIHSDAYKLEKLFDLLKFSKEKKVALKQEIEDFLYMVYEDTERKYGVFAEIGIDFALTKDLEIKFIECNSQSAKVSLQKAFGEHAIHHVMINILSYSKYLVNKKEEEKKEQSSEIMATDLKKWEDFKRWSKEKWEKLKEKG